MLLLKALLKKKSLLLNKRCIFHRETFQTPFECLQEEKLREVCVEGVSSSFPSVDVLRASVGMLRKHCQFYPNFNTLRRVSSLKAVLGNSLTKNNWLAEENRFSLMVSETSCGAFHCPLI